MLLLDPFSHCDICLEPYTSDETPQTPHAIPCGHVFCKTCLLNVHPANCPLCRKPFMPDRVKRIHVERPDNSDIYRHADYLKRLILTWGTSDEELALLLGDIEEWLQVKTDDGATALRKALIILRKYQRIQTKKEDYHRMIRRLKDQIASGDSANASKTEEFRIQNTDFENQVQGLQRLVIRYETELGGLRPLISQVENYEHELKKLRQQLEYYAYPSNSFRDNPLPQPPIPAAYESRRPSFTSKSRLSSSTSSYPKHTNDTRDGNPYTNGHTIDPSSDSNNSKRNVKGKEREHGPSYNLSAPSSNYDSSADPRHASYASLSLASTSDGVLPGASPRGRVVPTANSKPNLPDPEPKIEPKLVSGARPDLPAPQTPVIHPSSPLSGGMLDPPAAGRDYPDVYSFGAAYVSEYAAGHRAGYQLAEYTPGQAARVVPSQNTGTMNAAGNPYGNGYNANGERRETARGLTNMNALSMALSDVLSTPSMESNELSRDGNSQVGVTDVASTTTAGDSASSASSLSRRTPRRHSLSYHSPAQSQQTRATGQLTDNATLSSFNTGITDGSTALSRNRSLRQQPTFRSDESQSALFSGLGFTAPATNHTGNTGNTRPRYLAHASVPPPSLGVGIITTVPTTAPATADQAATAVTRDDRSGRSNFSASSWGTINTHSASILSWQSNGSNMMNFQLRNFASHAGAGSAPVDENWGPTFPPMMVNPTTATITVNSAGGNERNGNSHARDDSGGFRVVRESDEERTPVSRFSRTLPPVSSATATNGGDGGERLQVASENRDREGNREQERSDRRRDRRRSQPAPNTPSHTADAVRYAQVTEHATEQSRDAVQYGVPASYPNPSSSLLFQPANSTSSHSQPQPQGQSQPQTEDRRLRRRLSAATAPVESHHTSTTLTIAPARGGSEWGADAGYYTDVPSASSNLRLHTASTHHQESRNSVPPNSDAVGNNLITSPTLFNSNASSNALGLDGLNEQQQRMPLQISAPTPIVSSRSFLRSYSYDHF